MNIHMILFPGLFVAATVLAITSYILPEDGTVIVSSPSPIATVEPSPESTAAATGAPAGSPTPTPIKSAGATPSPSPSPSASASPSASPESFGIAATTPDAVLREAQVHAGRLDPFKSVYPPNLPDFEPAVDPEQLALPSLPPIPTQPDERIPVVVPTSDEPPPADPLEKGLTLKGIMDGGLDPVAIIEIDGQTELLRVGERIRGGILVTSISFSQKKVTLSRGQERGLLKISTPMSPSY